MALIQLNLGLVRCCFLNSAHCRVEEVRLDKLDRRTSYTTEVGVHVALLATGVFDVAAVAVYSAFIVSKSFHAC